MNIIVINLAIISSLLLLDAIYIGTNYSFLANVYKTIQRSPLQINPIGAVLCYVFLSALLYYFIILPKKSVVDAFLLGVGVYGVYELTNYTTFKDWPVWMVGMDTLWGGILFFLTTYFIRWSKIEMI